MKGEKCGPGLRGGTKSGSLSKGSKGGGMIHTPAQTVKKGK
jgi:hypothetical protein